MHGHRAVHGRAVLVLFAGALRDGGRHLVPLMSGHPGFVPCRPTGPRALLPTTTMLHVPQLRWGDHSEEEGAEEEETG